MTDVPRKQTIATLSCLVIVLLVISLALKVFLNDVGLWSIIALGFQSIAVVIMVVLLVRIIRGQRDDYWRERGNDRKHPDEADTD
jgi:membrane protein YdbS with pleckstrin-like domain